jgi:hypothetical protein
MWTVLHDNRTDYTARTSEVPAFYLKRKLALNVVPSLNLTSSR